MKKLAIFSIILALVLLITSAQEEMLGDVALPGGVKIEDINKIHDKFGELNETSYQYLLRKWLEMLGLQGFNNFLIKLSPIFVWVFGVEYDSSLLFFMAVFFWIYFLVNIFEILKSFSIFSKSSSFFISLCVVLILAQFKVFKFLTSVTYLLIRKDLWYLNLIRILIFIIILVLIVVFRNQLKNFIESAKRRREDMEKKAKEIADDLRRKKGDVAYNALINIYRKDNIQPSG